MIAYVRTLRFLVHLHVRSLFEYRAAVVLGWVSQAFSYASVYTAIALIILRFETLGGWVWPEMALLLSFHLLAYSMGAAFSFTQFRELEEVVRLGTFDSLMVKPISPWAYLVFSGFNIGYAGHVALAVGLMGWAVTQVDIAWSIPAALYFLASLVSSAVLVACVITMLGANALVWVRSRYLFSMFFGFWELARFPLNIFPGVIQFVMLTIAPLGFLAYVPVAVILGKDVVLLGPAAPVLALLAGPVAVLIAMAHWRFCIRNYQGAGG
jgi:ABC-2 type transport system permease protein